MVPMTLAEARAILIADSILACIGGDATPLERRPRLANHFGSGETFVAWEQLVSSAIEHTKEFM